MPAPKSFLRRAFATRVRAYHLLIGLAAAALVGAVVRGALKPATPADPFVALTVRDIEVADAGMARISAEWGPDSPAKLLEVFPHVGYGQYYGAIFDVLEEKTGHYPDREDDREFWLRWMWTQPPPDPTEFARFRARLYDAVGKPRLADYFRDDPPTAVRADEIRWGGVDRDGIPPVRGPKMTPAGEAVYLADTDKVFGVRINGDARAYPRRVLGHHELVTDTVGGVPVTGVYCPLCETMIAYHSRTADGQVREFGTSGFLYRSNKLMYDVGTLSLWHAITGKPVVGKLVGSGVRLDQSPVVTTTWGEWRAANPDTAVMAMVGLPGSVPNYGEGVAYWKYYQTDRPMFPVPTPDDRLKNKDEVFAPRLDGDSPPVAVAVRFLAANPVYHLTVGTAELVVVTTPGGANRAYAVGGRRFKPGPAAGQLTDAAGRTWEVEEAGVRSADGEVLPRVPGHRSFWFGWHAAHPQTVLVK